MAYSLIAQISGGGNSSGITVGSPDTTGANLIVIGAAWVSATLTISDSVGNTYTPLTIRDNGVTSNRLYYCANPTTNASHTFSATGTNVFPAIFVNAYAGADSSPFRAENGAATTTNNVISTGNVTAFAGDLVVTSLDFDNNAGGAVSVDGGFTTPQTVAYSAGNHEGGSISDIFEVAGATENRTWNVTNVTGFLACTIAVFKPAVVAARHALGPRVILQAVNRGTL